MATNLSFGLVDKSLLDKIDRLFTCNVGEYINLPQLVVLGDQSSGKSSVLAGLTELPFPRDSTLCTRFATQIIFRRAEHASIVISIIAGNDSSGEHAASVGAWRRVEQILDGDTFVNVLLEAAQIMGLSGSGHAAFSSDVLRIEISGPEQEHFSVIDVPGIFRKTVEGVTSKEDRAMVDEIVATYMQNPRSIMLTVVPANVDVATQDILERAEEVDPQGLRTLGILTKPDLVDKGAEHTLIDMLNGRQHPLRLGWHVLRNPGQADTFDSRMQVETDFFRKKLPWANLDKDKAGIPALKQRLQCILADHLRQEFPKVKLEISQRLKNAELELHALGPKRQTPSELTQFTLDLAIKFQSLVSLAIGTQYRQVDHFNDTAELRLATAVITRSEEFAVTMEKAAHMFEFYDGEDSAMSRLSLLNEVNASHTTEQQLSGFPTRLTESESDVAHVVHEGIVITSPQQTGIMDWLNKVYEESRGFELGTFNAQLIGVTMKLQAGKWREIALGYVSDIINLVHRFILAALKKIANGDRLYTNLRALLVDRLNIMYDRALSQTEFLLRVELNGMPATHNPWFVQALTNQRIQRVERSLKDDSLITKCKNHPDLVVSVPRLLDIQASDGTATQVYRVREIHDILQAYYSIARTRFVDNVRMQICDYFLVENTNTEDLLRPLELFSAKFVTSLTLEQLEDVAGEDSTNKNRRTRLEKEIAQLTLGKRAV